jgi:nickel/cobalt transporter (NiCoT) family protein
MIFTSAFTVYTLGLRHGADPDHLAAIDNMTRNSIDRAPRLSRFIGTLFAGGHTVMVLAIAGLVGYLGTRFAAHGELIETIGTWISIVVLLVIAALNLRQLRRGQNDRLFGMKSQMLPAALRNATSPWVAIPIGLLFGFGFETSSQVATYAVAFGADAGVLGALVVGSMFCAGMICTDTLDSVFIHRVVSYRAGDLPRIMRVWIWSVTIFAVAVAAYELAQVLGWKPPISDLSVSIALVSALLGVFVWIFLTTRRSAPVNSLREQQL